MTTPCGKILQGNIIFRLAVRIFVRHAISNISAEQGGVGGGGGGAMARLLDC